MSPPPRTNSRKQEPRKQIRLKVIGLVVLVLTIALLSTSYYNSSTFIQIKPEWIHATAVLQPDADPSVYGTINFIQGGPLSNVKITGEIYGLTPNALRGFHIHELGDISSGCASTGSHYNPTSQTHGAPKDLVRHVGDLGNIRTDGDGVAILNFEDPVIALSGSWSIVGRAVVVHVGTDDLGRGDNDDSKKTGNAGGRAACGVIGLSKAS